MRIKNLRDFFYILRFGLLTVSFPALLQGFWAGITRPFLDAKFRKSPHGKTISLPGGLGNVLSWEKKNDGVLLEMEGGFKEIRFLSSDCIRVWVSRKKIEGEPFSFAVEKANWDSVPLEFKEDKEEISLKSEEALLLLGLKKGLFSLRLEDGMTVIEEEALSFEGDGISSRVSLGGPAQFYGLGEKAFPLNHKGKRFRLWNTDPVTFDLGSDPMYSSIPFTLVLKEGKFFGLFLDNPSETVFDFRKEGSISLGCAHGDFVLFIFLGPSGEKVHSRYSELTGKPPLPPLWALGYHQSRWSYSSEDEVFKIGEEFRNRKIPCDAIHLDIDYMDGWRIFTWDKRRFPDPPQMAKKLKEKGFKLIPNVDCGVKRDPKYRVFREGMENGFFLKTPEGKVYFGPVWPGYSAFPDFTQSGVREWWKEWNSTLVEAGMAGVENDMDEPSVFGRGTLPGFLVHENEGKPIRHEECHNAYGLLTARASWEAWKELKPGERPFVLTRSTYAGGQRYGATWTADNQSTWEHLWLSIPMCLNLALSGFSFVGVDVGGFARNATGELLVRWMQLGTFLPFFRNHRAKALKHQEPWSFGQPFEDACRKAIELRYELLPYLYTAFFRCSQTGIPVIRPLIFDWPRIEEFQDFDREFLFGDSLLVSPVLEEKEKTHEFILPPGDWFDFFTGKKFDGGKGKMEVDLFSIPLFARSGAIIPTWKVKQFIGEELPREVILRLYPGDGESFLYEDDGMTHAYLEGKFSLTRFIQRDTSEGIDLSIEQRGDFELKAKRYTFKVFGLKKEPLKIEVNGKEFTDWNFEEGILTFSLEPPQNVKIFSREE